MTALRSADTGIDLGGGFTFRTDGRGETVVMPPLFTDQRSCLMSTAQLDAWDENALAGWLRNWGFRPVHGLRCCTQVHGNRVPGVTERAPQNVPAADGLWTACRRIGLVVKSADCAPVWIASGNRKRIGVVHAGWRGVAAGIIDAAISAVAQRETDVIVAVGPHLQACCFEVGPEVARHFAAVPSAVLAADQLQVARRRTDSVSLNLGAAIVAGCRARGVPSQSIFVSTACTRCRPDMFHSYRRNGRRGPLMAAVAMLP